MSESDESASTGKRKRPRRSLRVPVDEVPRPTQAAEILADAAPAEGGRTAEMPAFVDDEGEHEERRITLDDAPRDTPLEEIEAKLDAMDAAREEPEDNGAGAHAEVAEGDLFGVERDGEEEELEPDSTVVQEPPSETEAAEARAERHEDAPSVEVDVDREGEDDDEEDEDDDDHEEEDEPADDEEESAEEEEAADEDEPADEEESEDERAAEEEEAAAEEDEAGGARAAAPAAAAVVVQRMRIISTPPPAGGAADASDTQPGTELAVDVDEEPEVRVGAELDDLDVDVDEAEAEAAQKRDSSPDLPTEDADLLEDEEIAKEIAAQENKKRISKPPPPPPAKGKEAAVAVSAPPPPAKPKEAAAAAPPPPAKPKEAAAAAPTAAAAPREPRDTPRDPMPAQKPPPDLAATKAPEKKTARRNWWEVLFNDDYLRTVPIPHPKVIARQCDFIEQRFGLAQGATLLDVGCGLGLHAVELTRRGYLVVGLDLSLPMLSRAADEAQDYGFKINFLHADMREMSFDGAFDAVLCWGTTFGYFDDETNRQVVERLHRALKPRGLLMLDVSNRDFVVRNQPNLVWFEGDGCVVMEESQMNYITSRLDVKRTVILDDGRQRDNLYSLRLYSLHELGQILHQQGFRVVEVTGWEAHPGVFFGADSPKLIILAERRPAGPPPPAPGKRSPSQEIAAYMDSGTTQEMPAVKGEPEPEAVAPAEAAKAAPQPEEPEAKKPAEDPEELAEEDLEPDKE